MAAGAPQELLARARALAPRLRERAAQAEALRRVPEETIADLVAAQFPRICQPARFGGLELGWDAVCAVSMELARGCAAQAWVSNVFSEHTCVVALFPDEAQHEVWDDNPRALVSSSYAPSGRVTPVPGGVRVSGRYTFSSGVHHAHWSIIGGILPREGGAPYPAYLLIPARDRKIVDDWHVMGMAGTGSADFLLEDVFIPAHRILDENLVFDGRAPGAELNRGPVYRMPQKGIAQSALASVPIGAAQGAVDEFEAMMRSRVVRGHAMAEAQNLQIRLAESSAEAEAARRLVLGSVREVMDKLAGGALIDEADMMQVTRNAAFGAKLAQRAVTRLFEVAGGTGTFLSGHLQRAFRDIHAASQHIGIAWDRNATMYGRSRMGLGIKGFFPGR